MWCHARCCDGGEQNMTGLWNVARDRRQVSVSHRNTVLGGQLHTANGSSMFFTNIHNKLQDNTTSHQWRCRILITFVVETCSRVHVHRQCVILYTRKWCAFWCMWVTVVTMKVTNNTGCPTRYRTRHFFNYSNTNDDIATKFEQEYVRCVRNVMTS